MFGIANTLLIDAVLIAKDADGYRRGYVAQVPVRPVVIDRGIVVAFQEVFVDRVKHLQHHLLKAREIVGFPTFEGAHDFGGIGKFITVNAGGEIDVRGAAELLQSRRPGVENLDRFLRIRPFAGDSPPQGAGVGRGNVVKQECIVFRFRVHPVSSSHHLPHGTRLVTKRGVPVRGQSFPAAFPRFPAFVSSHPFEIFFVVQQAGVNESAALFRCIFGNQTVGLSRFNRTRFRRRSGGNPCRKRCGSGCSVSGHGICAGFLHRCFGPQAQVG